MKNDTTPKVPNMTKTFSKLSDEEKALWERLRTLKENEDEKPEGVSRGDRFCGAVDEYLELNRQIDSLTKEKEALRAFLYRELVKRNLGAISCPAGTATLAAKTKEVSDMDFLKEQHPDAFAIVPDTLMFRVYPSKD